MADLGGGQRAKAISPKPNCFVADLDEEFVQQIYHIAKRMRELRIQYHGQTNDLWGCLDVAKGAVFCHLQTLRDRPARL